MLQRLAEGPARVDDLCRHIEAEEGLPGDASLAGRVVALLARFAELGLVVRCDSVPGA